MKIRIIKNLPIILLSGFAIAFVFAFYGNVLIHPNNYLFSTSGDGIKNYFTYAYHIKHDSTFTNFEGMNYPYGENVLYTDCHPIVANLFKSLSHLIPSIAEHSIGLLNLLMILSILFTFIIIYLLLVELKLNRWISIFFSIGITLLAPQIFRLGGHLALSYSMAIPLSWLFTIKYIQNPRNRLAILLLVNNLFWMFIHAYLGMIVLSFVFSMLMVNLFSDSQKRKNLYMHIQLGTTILIPILIFYVYSVVTDTHVGRTNNPSGFFLYNAELDDVFLPSEKPFGPMLDKLSGGAIKLQWEAMGYVGIVNSLFFLFLFFMAIVSIFKSRARVFLKTIFDNRLLNISLIAAFIVLLFALAIPFKQFPKLLETFPILKQFRATGRFVWPFYFLFTAFAAYNYQKIILKMIKDKKKISIGVTFLVILFAITSIEGYHYHEGVSKSIVKSPNLFNKELLPGHFNEGIDLINPNEYQAILAVPFYYQGSESYGRPRVNESVLNSIVYSYHTGIPNVCANLTRTSIEESKNIVQIVSPNYYRKEIIYDLSSEKPFLMVKTGNHFTKYEQAIIDKGKSIYKNENIELLKISAEELFSDDRQRAVNDFKEKLPNLIKQDSFYVSSLSPAFYYEDFEDKKSDINFRGQACFSAVKKGKNTLAEFPANAFEIGKEYNLSMWMYNGEPDALNLWFRLIVEEYDEVNNKWYSSTFFPEQAETINNNWSLVEGVFSIKDPKNKIFIVTIGKENSKASLHIDDVLITEKGTSVYKMDKADNSLFYNNHRVVLQ